MGGGGHQWQVRGMSQKAPEADLQRLFGERPRVRAFRRCGASAAKPTALTSSIDILVAMK
jgi:hypothetical protein